jgi:hypothetical protein
MAYPRNHRSHIGNPQNSIACRPETHRDIRAIADLSNQSMTETLDEVVAFFKRKHPETGRVVDAMRPRLPLYIRTENGRHAVVQERIVLVDTENGGASCEG